MMASRSVQALIPGFILVSGVITGVVAFSGILPVLRPILVFGFLLVCPGWAFVRLLPIQDPIQQAILAIALSLAIDTVVAVVLLYSGAWSSSTGLLILIAISIAGSLIRWGGGEHDDGAV